MTSLIDEIYSGKLMLGDSGSLYQLDSTSISRVEGTFIQTLIRSNPNVKKTLEIGCAWGLSSLFICSEIAQREYSHHTIIDPFQKTQWDNVGKNNLEYAGFKNFEIIEEKSEIALPNLLKSDESNFDLIFIDGWHTFDQTLLELFYSLKLIKVGGLIVIDDVSMHGVRQAVDYILQFNFVENLSRVLTPNHLHQINLMKKVFINNPIVRQEKFKSFTKKVFKSRFYYYLYPDEICSMIAFRKTMQDDREWNWHKDVF